MLQHNDESAMLNFGINESEISIIESLNPSFIDTKTMETKNFLNHTDAFEDLQTKEDFTKIKLKSDKSSYSKKSKSKKGNITISKDFDEDSIYAQRRMTKPRKPMKTKKLNTFNKDQTQNLIINNYRNHSDESDVVHDELTQIAAIGLEDLLRECTPSGFGLQVKLQVKLGDCIVPHADSPRRVSAAS